jgi:hypothetical protein
MECLKAFHIDIIEHSLSLESWLPASAEENQRLRGDPFEGAPETDPAVQFRDVYHKIRQA